MSKENLPISVDNNKSLAEKRKEKRLIEEIKKSAKALRLELIFSN